MPRFEKQESDLQENVVFINRVAKVVKGGRRFSFAAVVVVGDGKGRVGAGLGKAAEVPEAIRKGVEDAKKNMINVALKNGTIPHESLGIYGAGKVIMRPAAEGTGIKAGGPVRAVLALAGVRNVLTKSLGSSNPINMVKATLDGMAKLENVQTVAAIRGKTVDEIYTDRRTIMKVIITLKKSVIGSKPEHIATVKALGLKKTNSSVVKELTPQIQGMVHAVRHLVECKEAE